MREAIQLEVLRKQHPNYSQSDVIKDFKDKTNVYNQTQQFAKKDRLYDLGKKVFEETLSTLKQQGVTVADQDYNTLQVMLLVDDWYDNITNIVKSVSPYVLPALETAAKTFAPNVYGTIKQLIQPQIRQADGLSTRIRKRWLLTIAQTPVANKPYSIMCSPARQQFGQWLAKITSCYQYYQVHTCTIEYVPTCSVTTSANIIYHLDLDLLDPQTSVNVLSQQYKAKNHAVYNSSSTTWDESELQRMVKRYMTSVNNLGAVEYKHDFGIFWYASSTTAAVGNFYIDLDIELSVPNFLPDIQYNQAFMINAGGSSGVNFYDNIIKNMSVIQANIQETNEIRTATYDSVNRNLIGRITQQQLQFNLIFFAAGNNTTPLTTQLAFYYSSTYSGSLTTALVDTQFNYFNDTSGNVYRFRIDRFSIPANMYVWFLPTSTGSIVWGNLTNFIQFADYFDIPDNPVSLATQLAKNKDIRIDKLLNILQQQGRLKSCERQQIFSEEDF